MSSVKEPSSIRNPKRSADTQSRSDWFDYYAGFSAGFVEDIVNQLDLQAGATLLDPWLGSGTTGEIAVARGLNFKGYDVNPAMLLIARARTFSKSRSDHLLTLIDKVARKYERASIEIRELPRRPIDPLEQWLQPRSAHYIRILESIVSRLDCPDNRRVPTWRRVRQISPATSVLYVALFRTLRHFIAHYRSSNPTWIKLCNDGPRVHVSKQRLVGRFLKEIDFLQTALNAETRAFPHIKHKCFISRASSTDLPLRSDSIDAIVSSPPYCTRIDYVRATLPELALMGFPNGPELHGLRNMMMGTPTIFDGCDRRNDNEWGPACNRFLRQVETHYSKASSTYYIKYFRQYFRTAFSSLLELHRVLKKSGHCVLVLQNSYYKEILNDLPLIFLEMASHLGLRLTDKMDFPVGRTLAGIHPDTKNYRTDFGAVESVLTFRKS